MEGQKFDIVFRGKLVTGFDEATVRANLARIFNKDEARISPLFSGGRKVLKRGLDRDTADKYRNVFRDAGAVVALVQDRGQPEPAAKPPPPPPPFGREVKAAYDGKATFQVDTGPPSDAPQGKASFAVDGSGEPEAASSGADVEEQTPADDMGALEMPGVSVPPVEAAIPDDEQEPQAEAETPAAAIDISSLSLIEEDSTDAEQDDASGGDEEPQAEAEAPAEAIDISSLSLIDDGGSEADQGQASTGGEGRASYVIDESEPEVAATSQGRASFAIDDSEPAVEVSEQPEESDSDDFGALEMPMPDSDQPGTDASSLSLVIEEDLESGQEAGPPVDDADLLEPGSQLAEPIHQDPPDIDTSSLTMSEVGITVDESERPAPVDIDTGDLATDEDYDVLDEAQPIPAPDIDTGDMDVMEVGVTVDETERPPPPDIDTSSMSTEEDYDVLDGAEKPSEPDIDISQLKLEDD